MSLTLILTTLTPGALLAASAWLSLRLESHGVHGRPRRRHDIWE